MILCPQVNAALIRIKLDISDTRVTAKHALLHSIRLNKALTFSNAGGGGMEADSW